MNGNCSIPHMIGIAIRLIPSLEEKGKIYSFSYMHFYTSSRELEIHT